MAALAETLGKACVGSLIRCWRVERKLSQLELALEAGISCRHLSYMETGRSHPSRDMITRLSDALLIPLRERNSLLLAAGYAPAYPDTSLETPELSQVRQAIALTLSHQEPYPAFVLNKHWDILQANGGATRIADFLIGGSKHRNMLHQFFDPSDLRRTVANWEEIARDLIRHLHGLLVTSPSDVKGRELMETILRYPGVPSQWHEREWRAAPSPVLTVEFERDSERLRFFSTVATFGTSQFVTVDELRIECVFPADDSTASRCRALQATG